MSNEVIITVAYVDEFTGQVDEYDITVTPTKYFTYKMLLKTMIGEGNIEVLGETKTNGVVTAVKVFLTQGYF